MSLELCPKCNKGHLRPTGQSSTVGESTDLFRETGSMRMFVCDNDSCDYKKPKEKLNEYIPIGETLEMKVIKANTKENTEDNTKENTDQ
jgi:hypothetical protein